MQDLTLLKHIGKSVESLRDTGRVGYITALGQDSDRPIVHWSGNSKSTISEWRHIRILD